MEANHFLLWWFCVYLFLFQFKKKLQSSNWRNVDGHTIPFSQTKNITILSNTHSMLDTRKGIYIWRSLLLLLLLILVLIFLLLLLVLLLLLLLLLLILTIVFWLLLFCNNFSSCKINVRKGTLKAKQLMEILVVTAVTISCDSVINHSNIFFFYFCWEAVISKA